MYILMLECRMCYLGNAVDVWVSSWSQPDNLQAIGNIGHVSQHGLKCLTVSTVNHVI